MTTLVVASGLYILAVLGVGIAANKRSTRSPEEYFLAGRTLGTFVLFMALFGTNQQATCPLDPLPRLSMAEVP